jgi:hypothetical protein
MRTGLDAVILPVPLLDDAAVREHRFIVERSVE